MVRLEHVLDSWKTVREDTIHAVEDFPAAEFDFRPAPDVMTFGELSRHILDAGDGLSGLLLAGDDNFATPDFREKMSKHFRNVDPGPAGLAHALRESMEQRTAQLAAQPADFFAHIITRFDGMKVTRLEMLQMVKEHELTHRATMFLCLRMKGIVPATTRRRMAKQAAR
ncbi:putative DinB family protein [Candidatus Sulfopaludibacter sp. SbA4]|nr:putative DinB family protein [Candidatus Sulfopaludibacter sp. SbA4]